jgi:hypothetical protein
VCLRMSIRVLVVVMCISDAGLLLSGGERGVVSVLCDYCESAICKINDCYRQSSSATWGSPCWFDN